MTRTRTIHHPISGAGRKRIKPHQLVIGIGCFMGAVHASSPASCRSSPKWHDDKRRSPRGVRRHPRRAEGRLLHGHPRACSCGARSLFAERVRNWERGAPDDRAHHAEERQAAPRATSAPASTCRRCCATRPPGIMHSLIYFGFLVLLVVTDGARDRPPAARRRSSSCTARTYQAYAFVGDVAGVVFLVGIVWAIVRRYVAAARTASASRPSPSTR